MTARLSAYNLRVAISQLLPGYYKTYEIKQACTAFGMPEVENAWAYNSKRVYVSNRLAGVLLPQMIDSYRCAGTVGQPSGVRVIAALGSRRGRVLFSHGTRPSHRASDFPSRAAPSTKATVPVASGASRRCATMSAAFESSAECSRSQAANML